MSKPPPEGLRRRGAKKYKKVDDESQSSSSMNVLSPESKSSSHSLVPPADTPECLTDCEDLYDDDASGGLSRISDRYEEDEYVTDFEDYTDSDDDDDDDSYRAKGLQYNPREMTFYLEKVLNRPLMMITSYREKPEGGAAMEVNSIDLDDENILNTAQDYTVECDSEVEDFEQSDADDTDYFNTLNEHNNEGVEFIDSILQNQFARLSTTDNNLRGRSNSDVDESGVSPAIIISSYEDPEGQPTTDEELLSKGEPLDTNYSKIKRRTKQLTKPNVYIETGSESDGSEEVYFSTSRRNLNRSVSLDIEDNRLQHESPNMTDSESVDLEEEDIRRVAYDPDDHQDHPENQNPEKIVTQISIDEAMVE